MNLQERFAELDLAAFASRPAAQLMHSSAEWDPPAGVTPSRKLLYFSIGIPDSATLPRREISEAMQPVLDANDDAAFRYGLGAGYFPLREWIAEHYAQERHYGLDADWFQITNGSSGAIDLVVRSLIDPGDVIIAEAPTYLGTLHNFRGVLADVHTVPADEHGLDVELLEEKLRELTRAGKRVKLLYTIATFQNPSGYTMTLERRQRLLVLAAQYGFYILDDEAYRELWFTTRPPPPIAELGGGYGVITVGSFSKILATGLRVGWIHARPELLNLFRRMRFAMGQNQMGLRMVGNFVQAGHMQPHLARMRALYHEKMQRTADALQRHAGDLLTFTRPAGGFYLWAALPAGVSAQKTWRYAYAEGVLLNPGSGFYPERKGPERQGPERQESGREHMRVAYAWIPLENIDEAARRLALACSRAADENTT